MRLIDADALPKYTGYALSANEVAGAVENAPTIDAVPVVRCRDCKHRYVDGDNVRFNLCMLIHNRVQPDDWFCADGERKDGAGNG